MKELFALLTGALALRDRTFTDLREKSSVLLRGFLVVLLVGLLAGVFQASVHMLQASQANIGISVLPPSVRAMIPPPYDAMAEDYAREGAGISVDIQKLSPQAGEGFRSVTYLLDWVGMTLSVPLSMDFIGWMLLAGLLVHLTSRWLGGHASIAQMLGLTALAFAPRILDPLSIVLSGLDASTGGGLGIISSLIGLIVFVWGIAIFIKATAVAQGFSLARALGAIILAFVVAALVSFLLGLVVGALFAILGSTLAGAR
ncbi:MAG: YIP1 family protein [Anaerolineae bacterium]